MNCFAKGPGCLGAITFICASISFSVVAAEPEPLARVEAFLDSTATLQGEFSQVLIDEHGQVLAESAGTMSIKRPGRFRWHYTTPDELLVLGDGEKIWSYDVELENATVALQADALPGNPAALLAGNSEAASAFDVLKSWKTDETDWVEMIPQEEQRDFRSVRLGFVDQALVAMELHDQLGQTTRIVFSRISQNKPVDDELFVFTPPAGVDVIQAGGLSP